MSRLALALSACLLLAACADSDWLGDDAQATASDPGLPDPTRGPARPAARASAEIECRRAAEERSGDASVQGFDETIQHNVFDRTYANCLKWTARSR